MNLNKTENYKQVLQEIKERVLRAQHQAMQAVNRQLIDLYWDIGKAIATRQEQAGWGKAVVQQLAKDLQLAFPGTRGFSAQNLWRMRAFYETYKDSEKLSALLREISWTHHLEILK